MSGLTITAETEITQIINHLLRFPFGNKLSLESWLHTRTLSLPIFFFFFFDSFDLWVDLRWTSFQQTCSKTGTRRLVKEKLDKFYRNHQNIKRAQMQTCLFTTSRRTSRLRLAKDPSSGQHLIFPNIFTV